MGFLDNLLSGIIDSNKTGGFSQGSAKAQTSGGGSNAPSASKGSAKATSYAKTGKSTSTTMGATKKTTPKKSGGTGGGSTADTGSTKPSAAQQALEDYATQSAVDRAKSIVEAPAENYGFSALNADTNAAIDRLKNAKTNFDNANNSFGIGTKEYDDAYASLQSALAEAETYIKAAKNAPTGVNRNTFNVEEYYEKAKETPVATSLLLADEGAYSAKRTEMLTDATDEEKEKLAQLQEQDKQNGTNEAEAYRREIETRIAQERGAAKAEEIQGKEGLGKALSYGGQAVQSGFGKTMNDLAKTFGVDTQDKTQAEYTADILRQGLEETGSEAAKTGFDVAQGIGAMIPSLVASSVPGGALAGKAVQGLTSASSAYQDKLAEGWEQGEAATYGLLEAASEVALSSALGGISKLGGTKSLSNLSKALTGKINNVLLRATANASVRALAEGGEEAMQTYISPAIESVVRSVPYDSPDFEEVLHNAVVGAATSAVLGVGEFASDIRNTAETPTVEVKQPAVPTTPTQAPQSANNAVSAEGGEITPSAQQNAEIGAPVEFNATTAQTTMGKGPERERNMSEGVRNNPANEAELRQSFEEAPEMYTQLTNAEVQAKADAILAKGFDAARSEVEQAVGRAKAGMKLAPEYAVAGHALANELTRRGELEAARNLESDIIAEFTAAGQFAQIGRLLRSDNPVAIERAIQKVLDKVSEEAHRKGFDWTAELTDAEKQLIAKTDFTQEGAYENVYTQIADRVGKEMPSTVWEKLQEVRRINMLLRPRTMIKNVAGNVPMVGVRKLSEGISAAIQNQLVKSGKMDASEQTRGLATQAERDMAKAYWESHSADILRQGNKWDFNSILREHRTIFKDTALKDGAIAKAVQKMTGKEVESFGEALRQTTYSLLEKGDVPFVQSAFIDSLAQYCAARGITSVDKVPQSAVDFATANAMEATFKKANVLAKALNDLKRNSSPTVAAAIDILMPFTTTPANILSLMGEYSPIGFAKLLSKEGPAAKVDAFSKASVGSTLMLMGYLLRSAGWITGGEDEDKDKAALDRATGVGTYSIGGKVSYDWAQPVGSLFALGAEISDAIAGQQSWDSAIMNAIYTAGDSVLNMSMFQNILKVLKGTGKPTQQIIDAIMEGGATQLIPGLAGDIAKIIDGTVRSTYTGGNVFDDIVARATSSTPGLSKTLPESVNVKGEVNTRGNLLERTFDTLFNPSTITRGERSEADEEIYRLLDATGSKTHIPSVSPYKFDYGSENYKLNGEERAQFQKTQGQAYYALLEQALESKHYEALNDTQKQDLLTQFRERALADAKAELITARGGEYEKDAVSDLENPADYLAVKLKLTDEAEVNGKTFDATSNYGFAAFADSGMNDADLDTLAKTSLSESKYPVYEIMRGAGFTPKGYVDGLAEMDENSNGSYSQAEMFAFLSQQENMSDEDKQAIWSALSPQSKTTYEDYLKKNGKSGGGYSGRGGYGGRYRGGSSKPANLGNSVGAVKSIANSGTTSNSSKYMRQALNDVISQSKKQQATQPTVKWEDLLAGYVKGIK